MTARLIDGELLAGVLSAVAWSGAAVAGRRRWMASLVTVAVLALGVRIGLVTALGRAGWWFVQEKVTVTLPLAVLGAAGAAVVAARREVTGRAPQTVALLVAGYAAAAGPVLDLFAGYRPGWGTGLLALGAVTVAGMVTWRVVMPPAPTTRPRVAGWLLASAPLVLGILVVVNPPLAAGPASAAAVPVSAVRGPDPATAGAPVRRFALTARTAEITLSSGRRVRAWTFDGRVPGPAIRVTQGDLVEVTLRNHDIADGVTLHWHGYDVPVGEDGVAGMTQDAVRPGQEFIYRFLADTPGTYWYHTHEVSDPGVRLGLYGTLVVLPRAAGSGAAGLDLILPVHTFGGTVAVDDRDGPTTHTVAAGTPVRLRVVNTDDEPHLITVRGAPFRVVAVDGADLNGPGELRRVAVRLPAGGRADLTLVTAAEPVTLRIDDHAATVRLAPDPAAPDGPADPGGWAELDLTRYGTPAATPFHVGDRYDRRYTMVLGRGLSMVDRVPTFAFTVNGRGFPHVTTQRVRAGESVLLTVVNRSRETHPIHLHGHHVLALTRNGNVFTGSPVWWDTFDVQPGEVWQVALRADNPGVWMNHCHNLRHAARGMAVHLAYDGYTAPTHHAHSA